LRARRTNTGVDGKLGYLKKEKSPDEKEQTRLEIGAADLEIINRVGKYGMHL
jgi:hypothetical protein